MEIAYVNIFVSDLDRAIDFYQAGLGLALQQAAPEHGYASFSAGPVHLGIAMVGADQQQLVGGHTGVGFSVANLEAEHARLAGLGVSFEMPPTKQPWGGYMALAADPDGNLFYLDEITASQ